MTMDVAHLQGLLFAEIGPGSEHDRLQAMASDATKPGVDLSEVCDRWILWLLGDENSPLAQWRAELRSRSDSALKRLVQDTVDVLSWKFLADRDSPVVAKAREGIRKACSAVPANDPSWNTHFFMMRDICIALFYCSGMPPSAPSIYVKASCACQAALFAFDALEHSIEDDIVPMIERFIFELEDAAAREA